MGFGFWTAGFGCRVSEFGLPSPVSELGFRRGTLLWAGGLLRRVAPRQAEEPGAARPAHVSERRFACSVDFVDFVFRVSCSGFQVSKLVVRDSSFQFGVLGFGLRVSSFGFRVPGFRLQVWDLESRVTAVAPRSARRFLVGPRRAVVPGRASPSARDRCSDLIPGSVHFKFPCFKVSGLGFRVSGFEIIGGREKKVWGLRVYS